MSEYRRRIRSFVRRTSRLSSAQEYALSHYRNNYCIELTDSCMDYESIFHNKNPVIVEIGFGMGHATIELAEKFPNYNFLGIEVHTPGVGKILDEIHKRQIENLKILQADAVDVLEQMIPQNSVAGFHIFFPDPWPKKKHHKRRLLQLEFVHKLTLRLCAGGYLYAATDWEEYAEQMLKVVSEEPLLLNPFNGFASDIDWRPKTSFERKGEAKQHQIREVWAEKILDDNKKSVDC